LVAPALFETLRLADDEEALLDAVPLVDDDDDDKMAIAGIGCAT